MKKKICLFALAALLYGTAYAQTTPVPKAIEYCEVLILDQLAGNNVNIAVDYGQERKKLNPKVTGADGKPLQFNSPIDALHYMTKQGWELVEMYIDPSLKYDNRHYIMKRAVSNS